MKDGVQEKSARVPAISVILPMYNVEEYLEQCVKSIYGQTFVDFELIMVDDVSTDNTLELAEKLAREDNRARIVHQDVNRGLSLARNLGLSVAKGKYIAFVDSDDWLSPDYLERLWQGAETVSADVVSMGYVHYEMAAGSGNWCDGIKVQMVEQPFLLPDNRKERIEILVCFQLASVAWGKLIKRYFLERIKLQFVPILSEDILFHFPLLYAAGAYLVLPDTLYHYRQNPQSLVNKKSEKKLREAMHSLLIAMRYVNQYLLEMHDINTDAVVVMKIRRFFAQAFMEFLFMRLANGMPLNEVYSAAVEVFEREAPDDSGLLIYLFEKYFNQKI